jgi:hypothetical protein
MVAPPMPLRRPLQLVIAIALRVGAAHADPCPADQDFRLSAAIYAGHFPLQPSDGQEISDECAPIDLDRPFADGADTASSSVQIDHGLAMQAQADATWDGVTTFGTTSGGGAELDDSFQVTGAVGPTASVQIAIDVTGGVQTSGAIEPEGTDARGRFLILSDQFLPEGDDATFFLCEGNVGTAPIACHTILHGTVPIDTPVPFSALLYVNLQAAMSAAHPAGSGSNAAWIDLAFHIWTSDGTIERASAQFLPEPGSTLTGVAALGALAVSSRRRRARRRSRRSRRPACACS